MNMEIGKQILEDGTELYVPFKRTLIEENNILVPYEPFETIGEALEWCTRDSFDPVADMNEIIEKMCDPQMKSEALQFINER